MRSSRRAPRDASSTNLKQMEPRAGFRAHNGAVTLHLDGRPQAPLIVDVLPGTSDTQVAVCVAGGARLFRLRGVELGWHGANQSDFNDLNERVQRLLANAPNANFLVEVDVEAPEWWRRAHKAECAVYCLAVARSTEAEGSTSNDSTSNDSTSPTVSDSAGTTPAEDTDSSSKGNTTTKTTEEKLECASRASRRWLLEAGDALARLAQHVAGAAWGDQCIGFQIAGGAKGGWRHPEWVRLPDIGPRMNEQFRAFCLSKYRRNAGLLKKEWDDPRADFDRIKCPSAYERRYADVGCLRDSMRSRRMLDYYECFYTAQNEAALHFCTIAKRAGGGRLVGLEYAGILGTESNAEGSWGLPEAIFDSEYVDYLIASPPEMENSSPSAFTGSLRLRGKFVFLTVRNVQSALADAGKAQTLSSGALLPADLAREQLETILRIGERSITGAVNVGKSVPQVAVIVDAFGQAYIAGKEEDRAAWQRSLYVEQFEELSQSGAQAEAYLLSDLFHSKFPDHKVTLFLNTLYLTEAERRKIDARVKRGQQVGVWLWGAGVLSETGVDAEAGGRLIGLKLRLEKNATSLRTRIVEGNDPLTWGLHVGATFGPERAVTPTLTVGDKTATRLGANTANKTTFAVKRSDTWTSVHYGTVPVPASLLRNTFQSAGVHLYADNAQMGTTVYANARLLVVSSRKGGSIKVNLPGVHEVLDTRNQHSLTVGSEVAVTLKPGETRVLELRPVLNKLTEIRRKIS